MGCLRLSWAILGSSWTLVQLFWGYLGPVEAILAHLGLFEVILGYFRRGCKFRGCKLRHAHSLDFFNICSLCVYKIAGALKSLSAFGWSWDYFWVNLGLAWPLCHGTIFVLTLIWGWLGLFVAILGC